MHIVEVSDSSSERMEGIEREETKERKRKNFTTSPKKDEESGEPIACVPTYCYAIKI